MREVKDMSKRLQSILAFAFGVVFIVVMIFIASFTPYPSPFQLLVYRVVLGLAAAGVAAMIPGFLSVTVPKIVRAGGAIAVFVLIYFYNPASLSTKGVEVTDKVFITKTSESSLDAEYHWKQANITFRFPKKGWDISTKSAAEGLGDLVIHKHDKISTQIQIHVSILDDKYFGKWQLFKQDTSQLWENTISQFGPFSIKDVAIDGVQAFEMVGTIIGNEQKKKLVNLVYLPLENSKLLEFHLTRNQSADSTAEQAYMLLLSTVKIEK